MRASSATRTERAIRWLGPAALGLLLLAPTAEGGPRQRRGTGAVTVDEPGRPRLIVQRGHSAGGYWLSFSADGRLLASAGRGDGVLLSEVATGRLIRVFAAATFPVVLSRDGSFLVATDGGRRVMVLDTATGRTLAEWEADGEKLWAVAVSPDGRRLLTGGYDRVARLWELQTEGEAWQAREIGRFEGHAGAVRSVEFSAGGDRVLTGSGDGTARLWETASGAEIRAFRGHRNLVDQAVLSPDSAYVLTGSHDSTVRLWETGSAEPAWTGRHDRKVTSVAFSPDGRLAISGGMDSTARVWSVPTGEPVHTLDEHRGMVRAVGFSPDGERMISGSDGDGMQLWGLDGTRIRRFEGQASPANDIAFSPDGRFLVSGHADGNVRVWDLESAFEPYRLAPASRQSIQSLAFSPDGRRLLVGRREAPAQLWDLDSGELVREIESDGSPVAFSPDGAAVAAGAILYDLASGRPKARFPGDWGLYEIVISRDGRRLVTGGARGLGAHLWDIATATEERRFRHPGYVAAVALSGDGRQLLTGGRGGEARLFDVDTGKEIRRLEGHRTEVFSVAFGAGDGTALTGSGDRTARLWEVATGSELRRFEGHSDSVREAIFHPGGRFVVTASDDQTIRLWDASDGRELAQLLSFADGTWAVVDPEGRFDASHGGGVSGLHWVVGMEAILLSQLKERYYDPFLLAKVSGFHDKPPRRVEAFNQAGVELFPAVTILHAPRPGATELRLRLVNRGGGIGRVAVFVNGKEIEEDARPEGADPTAATLEIALDLAGRRQFVPGQDNAIEVVAYNAQGYLASRGGRTVGRLSDRPKDPPRLWGLAVGVSDYLGDALDLRYAAKDAHDFATALRIGAEGLLGAEPVRVTTLADDQVTRAGLEAALAEIERQARSTDLLVIYLAGHGVTPDSESDYHYLLYEAQSLKLDDRDLLRQTAISSRELTERIKAIPALKQVLILDTCASGQLIDDLFESRSLDASQIRAIERMKDRTGMFVLAGSAADAVSYETSRYGQGLLTYSLLMGMHGGAIDDDQLLDVSDWFSFAADRVPELAEGIGGIQQPRRFGDGQSFDLGRLTPDDRRRIPLATVKPVVTPANFVDERYDDRLRLRAAVNEVLRSTPSVVFVEAAEFPAAYRLAGPYRSDGGVIEVEAILYRGDEELTSFSLREPTGDVRALATMVVAELATRLRTLGD